MPEASALWLKEGFRRYHAFAVRKTMECGAEVHLNTKVTKETVEALKPDILILATGAEEFLPPVKGLDGANVVSVFHGHSDANTAVTSCSLTIGLETRDFDQIAQIKQRLTAEGFTLID